MSRDFEPVVVSYERMTCHGVIKDGYMHNGGKYSCMFEYCVPTPNSGFATDHYCKHPDIVSKKVMGYVEYSNDEMPVPAWCPLRIDRKEAMDKQNQETLNMVKGANI